MLPLGRGRELPRPEGGTLETPGRVQPHSLLRESVTGGELHRHWPSSQALGLSQNAAASHALAFFTGTGPFPKRDNFTGIGLLHRHRAFPKMRQLHRHWPSSQAPGISIGARPRSGIEPPEMLNVPRVLDRYPLCGLQARGARPGDMNNLEWALPHGRELVQPLPGADPSEQEVPYLKSSGADVAAVVSPQRLLIPCRS